MLTILSLNVWGGKRFGDLARFLKAVHRQVDIFCFQEVFHTTEGNLQWCGGARANLFSEIQNILTGFNGFISPVQEGINANGDAVNHSLVTGPAMFFRKDLIVEGKGEFFVFGRQNQMVSGNFATLPRNIQFLVLNIQGERAGIFNFHGLWDGGPKTDTPERVEQSRQIRLVLDTFDVSKIVVGDFNLRPKTESLSIIEGDDLANLVTRDPSIRTTRSKVYYRRIDKEPFADYALVSKQGIEVERFAVLETTHVADHLPLLSAVGLC